MENQTRTGSERRREKKPSRDYQKRTRRHLLQHALKWEPRENTSRGGKSKTWFADVLDPRKFGLADEVMEGEKKGGSLH